MGRTTTLRTLVFVVAGLWTTTPAYLPARDAGRLLDCDSTFPPTLTAADLVKTYGPQNLGSGQIHTGEGRFHNVTVLFPHSVEDKLEIVWFDEAHKQAPAQVWIRSKRSRWRTKTGLTVGMDLRSVERLNGRPFVLSGFGWDYAGTVVSWRNGKLDPASRCSVRATFAEPRDESEISRQVAGGRDFSSRHPGMRAVNPRVEWVWLEYP